MTTLKLFSTLAVKGALSDSILPSFGSEVAVTFAPTGVLRDRIAAGEPFDLVIAIDSYLDAQAAAGIVATPVSIVSTGVGVAVGRGAARPEIGSVEAFKNALTKARSVAYSRTGASGVFFASLLERLGIADAVNEHATILPKGLTAEAIVDGRSDLAIQQISELLAVRDVDILGPIPAEIQETTRFAAALSARSNAPVAATKLLQHLTSPAALDAYRLHGLDICFGTSD